MDTVTKSAKKVLVISGSPQGKEGNTEILVDAFVRGLEAVGAVVKRLYTNDLKVKPCCGKLICWLHTPGVCAIKDDMRKVLPEVEWADVLVLASPVFVGGMPGPLKNLLDRFIPMGLPFIVSKDGHCRHPRRNPGKGPSELVLISNAGFHELDNFEPILANVKDICKNSGYKFSGALLRPHGPTLKRLLTLFPENNEFHQKAADVLVAAEQAGRELVASGEMSKETLSRVSNELLSVGDFQSITNAFFEQEIEKNGKMQEVA